MLSSLLRSPTEENEPKMKKSNHMLRARRTIDEPKNENNATKKKNKASIKHQLTSTTGLRQEYRAQSQYIHLGLNTHTHTHLQIMYHYHI